MRTERVIRAIKENFNRATGANDRQTNSQDFIIIKSDDAVWDRFEKIWDGIRLVSENLSLFCLASIQSLHVEVLVDHSDTKRPCLGVFCFFRAGTLKVKTKAYMQQVKAAAKAATQAADKKKKRKAAPKKEETEDPKGSSLDYLFPMSILKELCASTLGWDDEVKTLSVLKQPCLLLKFNLF